MVFVVCFKRLFVLNIDDGKFESLYWNNLVVVFSVFDLIVVNFWNMSWGLICENCVILLFDVFFILRGIIWFFFLNEIFDINCLVIDCIVFLFIFFVVFVFVLLFVIILVLMLCKVLLCKINGFLFFKKLCNILIFLLFFFIFDFDILICWLFVWYFVLVNVCIVWLYFINVGINKSYCVFWVFFIFFLCVNLFVDFMFFINICFIIKLVDKFD